jgi:hypothetical protein
MNRNELLNEMIDQLVSLLHDEMAPDALHILSPQFALVVLH